MARKFSELRSKMSPEARKRPRHQRTQGQVDGMPAPSGSPICSILPDASGCASRSTWESAVTSAARSAVATGFAIRSVALVDARVLAETRHESYVLAAGTPLLTTQTSRRWTDS
jgi:hypothetical protein